MDLNSVEARLLARVFGICTSSTKKSFPSDVYEMPAGLVEIHPSARVYLGPRIIYAMVQIKYFNRRTRERERSRTTPKNGKNLLILFVDLSSTCVFQL